MENLKLVFKKALEDLGLNPGEYKFILTGDIPSLNTGALGTACRVDKTIWVKENQFLKRTIYAMLHEVRHLAQFKQGYKYPDDVLKMEKDANRYAIKNVLRFMLIAKYGIEPDLKAILTGIKFFNEINKKGVIL